MALPINIEDLLNKQKIESNRIEFKSGWNPDKIYHTICAFATDLDNTGGGYILVGVEQDENGLAKRPVKGLPVESIDEIMKDMVGYDKKSQHLTSDLLIIIHEYLRKKLMVRLYLRFGFPLDPTDHIACLKA